MTSISAGFCCLTTYIPSATVYRTDFREGAQVLGQERGGKRVTAHPGYGRAKLLPRT